MESGPISSWIAGKHSYQVIRRGEYGPGAVSTRVRQVRPAKIWTSQPVDASVKQQLESDIHTWKQELNEVQEKIDADKELLTRLGREHQATDRERVCMFLSLSAEDALKLKPFFMCRLRSSRRNLPSRRPLLTTRPSPRRSVSVLWAYCSGNYSDPF